MGIGKRIKEAREELKLTQKELGNIIGVTAAAITNYETEVSHPKEVVLYKLINALKCTPNYLFQDSVNVVSEQTSLSFEERKLLLKYHKLDLHGKELVDTILKKEYERVSARHLEDTVDKKPKFSIKVFKYAAAAGLNNPEPGSDFDIIEVDSLPYNADFGVRISGDSMEPKIPDGCIVWVQDANSIDIGKTGIFSLNGEIFCKRLIYADGHTVLNSINEKYKDKVIGEFDDLRTYGRVVGVYGM